jgi:hypothetical protein
MPKTAEIVTSPPRTVELVPCFYGIARHGTPHAAQAEETYVHGRPPSLIIFQPRTIISYLMLNSTPYAMWSAGPQQAKKTNRARKSSATQVT